LVSFWATWCINCKTDLPALAELQRIMGRRVQVEAISTDKTSRDDVRKFVVDLGISGLSISLDPDGLLGELDGAGVGTGQFPTYGMPITYLVTPRGLIAGYVIETADWLSDAGQKLISYYQ
jgi:thiol-disulfide isomerase/thioredoxin